MSKLPDYVHTPGSPVQRTPMHMRQSEMYGFVLKGDIAKLQAAVDQSINSITPNAAEYKVVSTYMLLTFTRVSAAQSGHPIDKAKGWGQEHDIATWILVGSLDATTGKLKDVFFYPHHIWVDVATAVSIGREVFGYPKNGCRLTMPATMTAPHVFELVPEGWDHFDPTTQLGFHQLLTVTRAGGGGGTRVSSLAALAMEGFGILSTSAPDLFDAGQLPAIVRRLSRPRINQLFLKQFPDAGGRKAVYRALVAAPAVVDTVRSATLLDGTYTCQVNAFDSFPLANSLGLTVGPNPVFLAFHLDFDFTVHAGRELARMVCDPTEKTKVAVLGGGAAAMAAAFFLTDCARRDRYDVTVYQMGWRLGGKGASGRNAALGQRIEEHGLHIWFGFYLNAFRLMRSAYEELNRPAGSALASIDEAFLPQQGFAVTERASDGTWKIWPFDELPTNGERPWDQNEAPPVDEILQRLLGKVTAWGQAFLGALGGTSNPLIANLIQHATNALAQLPAQIGSPSVADLEAVERQISALFPPGITNQTIDAFVIAFPNGDELRRKWILFSLATAVARGMLKDGVVFRGFDHLNDQDFRTWLCVNGASPLAQSSAILKGLYDLVFGYANGDVNTPNAEAGTMLRGALRIVLGYHGAVMWKMAAGMGDVMFAPLYQVLRTRGVRFEFFHKVEDLTPRDGAVQEIVMTRQADHGAAPYDPLVDVKGLPCWPNEPKYALLDQQQAQLLQVNNGIDLESYSTDWADAYRLATRQDLPRRTLVRGTDFDEVVFALPVSCIEHTCKSLLALGGPADALRDAFDNIRAVPTQAYQVWTVKTPVELGWNAALGSPLVTAFTFPFDTWASMDHTLKWEAWPQVSINGPIDFPTSVSYFCSVLPVSQAPRSQQLDTVRTAAEKHFSTDLPALLPGLQGAPWDKLHDPQRRGGRSRFAAQYWRPNVEPSDLYSQSIVGTTRHRPTSSGSGFSNLYLAGDWIKTGLDAGCVEAAVMSGMQASRDICGAPASIPGENDL